MLYSETHPVFGELKLAHEHLQLRDERAEHEWIGDHRVFVGEHLVEVAQECERRDGVEFPVQLVEDESFHAPQVVRSPAALAQLDEVGSARNDPVLLLHLRCDVEAARRNAGEVSGVCLVVGKQTEAVC